MLRHRDDAEIVTAPISPRRCGASCSARYGDKALYEGGLSVRTSLDPACRRSPTSRCATGSSPMTGPGGYRGPVGAYRSRRGDWPQRLAAAPLPAGAAMSAGSSPWCCAPKATARRSASTTARPGASRSRRCAGRGRCAMTARSGRFRATPPMSSSRAIVVLVEPLPERCRQGRGGDGEGGAALRPAPDPRGLGRARRDRSAYRPRARR